MKKPKSSNSRRFERALLENGTVLAQTKEHNAYVTSALKQIQELGYDLEKTPMQIYTALDPNVDSQVKIYF